LQKLDLQHVTVPWYKVGESEHLRFRGLEYLTTLRLQFHLYENDDGDNSGDGNFDKRAMPLHTLLISRLVAKPC